MLAFDGHLARRGRHLRLPQRKRCLERIGYAANGRTRPGQSHPRR